MAQLLIVDDDDAFRETLAETLESLGHAVAMASGGAEALEALSHARFDAVFLDHRMPGMDGLQTLAAMQARVARMPPVIVLTGRNDRTGVEAVAAGAQDYLVKDDITPDLLDRTIKYAVQRRQAQLTEFALREERLLAARVISKKEIAKDVVSIGSHVRLKDMDANETVEYHIVGSAEANPAEQKLSNESPVGKAILGHKKGETVEVTTPRGSVVKFKIMEIKAA